MTEEAWGKQKPTLFFQFRLVPFPSSCAGGQLGLFKGQKGKNRVLIRVCPEKKTAVVNPYANPRKEGNFFKIYNIC
jgi:hypothetical protein